MILKKIYDQGFFHLLSANYFTAFFAFISQLLVAWWLMPIDIGRLKILQTFLNIFVVVGLVGFDTSVVRLCAIKRPLGECQYLLKRACLYVFPVVFLIYSVLCVAAYLQGLSSDPMINRTIPFYMLILFPFVYLNLMLSYLRAIGEFKALAKGQSILKVLAVGVLLLITYKFGVMGYISATLINFLGMMIFFILLVRRHFRVPSILVQKSFQLHWRDAKYAVMINTITQVSMMIDILIVNYLVTDRALVGQYSFATIFIVGFNILFMTFQQMALPYLSNKSSDLKEVVAIVEKYKKPLRWVAFGGLTAGLISVPLFVHIVFGGKYDASLPFFCILFVAWFFRSCRILQWTALLGMGVFKGGFYISCLNFLFGFLFSFILTRWYDIQGAAWGQLIASLLSVIVVSYVYDRFVRTRVACEAP